MIEQIVLIRARKVSSLFIRASGVSELCYGLSKANPQHYDRADPTHDYCRHVVFIHFDAPGQMTTAVIAAANT